MSNFMLFTDFIKDKVIMAQIALVIEVLILKLT